MTIASPDDDELFNSPDPDWVHSWRAQPNNEVYWKIFLARYFPYIETRLAKYAMKPQDSEDLQQEILSKILLTTQSMAAPIKVTSESGSSNWSTPRYATGLRIREKAKPSLSRIQPRSGASPKLPMRIPMLITIWI